MRHIVLAGETDWQGWRQTARRLVLAAVEPADLLWSVGGAASDPEPPPPDHGGRFAVPRALVELASIAIQAREPDRFGLLYTLVWRSHTGEKVLEDPADPDLSLARRMALAVRAEAHRMRTHLRFLPAGEIFLGWFAPAHFVLPANAQLIAERFPDRPWSIITPDGSAHWDRQALRFGAGLRDARDDETLLAWWDAHRANVLDSATGTASVPPAEALDEQPRPPERSALAPVVLPSAPDAALVSAAKEAWSCRRCPLHEPATQPVFGEGPAGATAMFVGEQPGDQEDTIGRPFVGPAGQMMDRAMEAAGLDRRLIYITNAVKHFKFTPRGKRRIHQTPELPEIRACGFWLDVERATVRPRLLVLMGATAARAVLGRAVTISRERSKPFRLADGQLVFVTVHPSYLLRIPEEAARAREYAAFVQDMKAIRTLLETP